MSQILSEHELMNLKIREVRQPNFVLITTNEAVKDAYNKMLYNHGSDYKDNNEELYNNYKELPKRKLV